MRTCFALVLALSVSATLVLAAPAFASSPDMAVPPPPFGRDMAGSPSFDMSGCSPDDLGCFAPADLAGSPADIAGQIGPDLPSSSDLALAMTHHDMGASADDLAAALPANLDAAPTGDLASARAGDLAVGPTAATTNTGCSCQVAAGGGSSRPSGLAALALVGLALLRRRARS